MRFCQECGSQISDGAKFCPVCGKQTGISGQAQTETMAKRGAAPQYQPVQSPIVYQGQYQVVVRPPKKVHTHEQICGLLKTVLRRMCL